MQFNSYIVHAKNAKIKHYEIITLKAYKFYIITFCLFNDKKVIPLIRMLQIKTWHKCYKNAVHQKVKNLHNKFMIDESQKNDFLNSENYDLDNCIICKSMNDKLY